MPSDSGVSNARLMACLAIAAAGCDIEAIFSAADSASSINLSAGTMRLTRPERSASAASIIRPVRHRSIALDLPIARVSRWVPPMPGMVPSVIAGGKSLFIAGDQDATDLVVGLEVIDRGGDLAKHAERQRVEHFRAVQRDYADRAFALDNDVFECSHGSPRCLISRAMCPLPGWASSGARSGDAPDRARSPKMDHKLRHEHPRGGSHRQQCAEGDEDLPDQRGLIPGRA